MANPQRHDYRGVAPQKHGKPNVTYPYGDLRFPRIIEVRTAAKGVGASKNIAFLTPHPNQQSYPGAVLIEQNSDAGDDTDQNVTETYEVLPGPIFPEVTPYGSTGIPMETSRQKRASTDLFQTGELTVANGGLPVLNIVAVLAGNPSVVTVGVSALSPQDHMWSPRMFVTVAGTGTALDGPQQILAVPATNQVSFAVNIAVGVLNTGTVTPLNRIIREIKVIPNTTAVIMKIDTMVACADVTVYNEDFKCWKDYQFPDFLKFVAFYNDLAKTTDTGAPWNSHISWGGAVGLPMQDGYHGPCRARRQRFFFVGPPPDSFEEGLSPTFIMPASGTFVIEGGATSINYNLSTGQNTTSRSNSFRTGRIPHCLNGGTPGIVVYGEGQATVSVDMPPSVPARFIVGDTITLMGQPEKHDAGALWEVIVWIITIPYTSGLPVNGFDYTTNPANYPSVGSIAANDPVFLSGSPASPFTIDPPLPSGLAFNSTTGEITGSPTVVTPRAIYTVTVTVGSVTQTALLDLTIFLP